jgi:hypothetical protein
LKIENLSMAAMLKRRLTLLNHPNPETFDINGNKTSTFLYVLLIDQLSDETEYRSAVLWLEDQKIRHYKIEDRGSLRNITDADVWNPAFQKYQIELGSPVIYATPIEQLTWLTSLAVRLEYSDNGIY